jgi:hypothetical protein
MRRVFFIFAIFFFLIALGSPLRFAYAAVPQDDPIGAARSAIESVVQSLTPPPLQNSALPAVKERSVPKEAHSAQIASAIAAAARNVTSATIVAGRSAGKALSHALAQTASAWSSWVYLANSDFSSPVKTHALHPAPAPSLRPERTLRRNSPSFLLRLCRRRISSLLQVHRRSSRTLVRSQRASRISRVRLVSCSALRRSQPATSRKTN